MNAGEMVTKLRLAMGDEVEPYIVPTATIFEWLSDAYLRIQIEFDQWKFLHYRGLVLTTVPGQEEYTLITGTVKEISKASLYCNRVGETVRFPMVFMEYDQWVAEEQINLQRAGDPLFFVKLPSGNYVIDPIPTEVWQVSGDVWYKPTGFTSLSSSPIWDSKYHGLVVWEALKVAAMEWVDNIKKTERTKAARIKTNLAVNLVPMRRAFNYEYLAPKGSAEALL